MNDACDHVQDMNQLQHNPDVTGKNPIVPERPTYLPGSSAAPNISQPHKEKGRASRGKGAPVPSFIHSGLQYSCLSTATASQPRSPGRGAGTLEGPPFPLLGWPRTCSLRRSSSSQALPPLMGNPTCCLEANLALHSPSGLRCHPGP